MKTISNLLFFNSFKLSRAGFIIVWILWFWLAFLKKANQDHKIQTIIKPALESLKELKNNKFDMVFIDADKMNYKEYYEKSLELLSKGGLIIIDNVLWHGEVADEKNNDKFTINIREFNEFVSKDKRVEQIIIPLGDGMTVCRVL